MSRVTCRAGGGTLQTILDLGSPVLSDFMAPLQPDPPSYPLQLTIAPDSKLVQLRDTVPAPLLYANYYYRSGTNELMRNHLRYLADTAKVMQPLEPADIILDIGSNDGTLLGNFKGSYRIGCDPSNIEPESGTMERHWHDFFSAEKYPCDPAKLVFSVAMFYDLDNPVQFCREVASIMADDGLWVIEQHYLYAMLLNNGFDAICHEHLAIYSLESLEYVLAQADLVVTEVTENAINGGSFTAYVRKQGVAGESVLQMRQREAEWPNDWPESFGLRVLSNKMKTLDMLHDLQRQGKFVLGYGASTKGSTIAQFYGIDSTLIPAIADRNPEKWGLVTSGTRIPILSEVEARAMQPDVFFVFPYHFLAGFLKRETAFLTRGCRFFVPMPIPRLLP